MEFFPCTWSTSISVSSSTVHQLLSVCPVWLTTFVSPVRVVTVSARVLLFFPSTYHSVVASLLLGYLISWSGPPLFFNQVFLLSCIECFYQLLQVKYNLVWKKEERVPGVCFSMQILFYFYIYIFMNCCLNCLLYLEFDCYMIWVRLLKLEIWTPNHSELHWYSQTQAKDISELFYFLTNWMKIFHFNLEGT